jgi:Coenzyme PQQ synthesis protein D (PqqD)
VAEHSSLVRWSVAPSVSVAVRDRETVLLDVRGGAYYVLNETGGAVWAVLRRGGGVGATLGEVLEALVAEYDASAERMQPDVVALLARWEGDRLVRRVVP